MADFSIQDLAAPVVIGPDSTSIYSIRQEDQAEIARNKAVEDASFGEKLGASWEAFKSSNFIAKGTSQFIDSRVESKFEPDPNFVMDDEFALQVLKDANLPMSSFGDIREVKSLEQMYYRVRVLQEEAAAQQRMRNALGDKAIMASSFVGSIVDIDLAVGLATGGLGTAGKAGKALTLTKLAKYPLIPATEAGIALYKYKLDPTYTVEDGFLDVFTGVTVGYSGAAFSRSLRNKLFLKKNNVPTDVPTASKPSAIRPAETGEVIPLKRFKTAVKDREVRLKAAKTYDEKLKVADGLDDIELQKSKAIKTNEELNYRIVREQELQPLRSKVYSKNRATFFDKQVGISELGDAKKAIIESFTKNLGESAAKQTDELLDAAEKFKTNKAINKRLNSAIVLDEFTRVLDEMDGDVKKLKDGLDDLIKEVGDKEFNTALASIEELYPKEVALIKDLVTKPLDETNLNKFVKSMRDMGYKQKTALAAAMLMGGSASLEAADSSDISASSLITATFLAAAALVVAPSAVKAIKNGAIRKAAHNIREGWNNSAMRAEYAVSEDASRFRRLHAALSDSLHTRITSTVEPIKKSGKEAADIVDRLLYSSKSGSGAEIDKQSWVHGTMNKYVNAEKEHFDEWLKERGISRLASYFDEEKNIYKFREEVSDAIELMGNEEAFKSINSDAIKKMANKYDAIKKEIYDRATEYEVKGFVDEKTADGKTIKGVQHEKGMLPRYWKPEELNRILNSTDEVGEAAIRKALTDAINKTFNNATTTYYYYKDKAGRIRRYTNELKDPKSTLVKKEEVLRAKVVADEFIDNWKSGRTLSHTPIRRGEDIMQAIEPFLKEDTNIDDIANALSTPKDVSARAKHRIKFDINDIEPFTIKIDGVDTRITKANFVERDAKVILDRTANSIYGQSALAKAGWKTTEALKKSIDKVPDAKVRNELNQITDLVLGIPIPSNNPWLHELSMITKDVLITAKLPLVVLSTPPELINTIMHQGLGRSLRNTARVFRNMFGDAPKNSNLAQMIEMTGLGTSVNRLDFTGFRGFTDQAGDLDDVTALSSIRNGTMKMRDFSIYLNQLGRMGDMMQRAGMEMNLEKIANFIHKNDTSVRGIEPHRAKEWGIDDAFVKEFKNKIKFNEDGTLATMNSKEWSIKSRDKLASVLRVMNQQISPETTIGETPLFSRTTDLGRTLTGLITYPMMQFNEYGLNDLRHLDKRAVIHATGAFIGSYLGLQARYAIQGKDVDEETVILYAILNMPQAGMYSSIKGMLSPAMFSVAKDAHNLVAPQELDIR